MIITRNRISLLQHFFIFICSLLIAAGCKSRVEEPEPVQIKLPEKAEFIERKTCIECHEEQYKEWVGSHHDMAMDAANDETVIGDFNNSAFTHQGVTSTFYKK
jgi:hypothetical protein